MRNIFFPIFFILVVLSLNAQIPELPPQAIYLMKADGGYDLYIKKLDGVGSIILTESQRDPLYQVTAYSLRATKQNTVNAGEKRILDGRRITTEDSTTYCIDSTPEKIETLGEFFHFFLTDEVVYGYSWTRNGTIKIESGLKINVRMFEKKYGDYSGKYADQWITLTPLPLPMQKAEAKSTTETAVAKSEATIVLLHVSENESPAPTSPVKPEDTGKTDTTTPEIKPEVKPAVETTPVPDASVKKEEIAPTTATTPPAVTNKDKEAELPPVTKADEKPPAVVSLAPDTTVKKDETVPTIAPPAEKDITSATGGTNPPHDEVRNLASLIEKISAQAGAKTNVISSFTPVVIKKTDEFPYKNLPDGTSIEQVVFKGDQERILIKISYEIDKDNISYSSYHFDEKGRLILIGEYTKDNMLAAVYKIEYNSDRRPMSFLQFDKSGKLIETK